jgi:ATP-dependent DNA helicase RecQ
MMAYATTRLCRHGYISAYFGGRSIESCGSCDNCLAARAGRRPSPRRQRSAQRPAVPPAVVEDPVGLLLQAVAELPYPLGRTGLARALVGADDSPVTAREFALYGRLAGHTRKSVGQLAAQLVDHGLLAYFSKGRYTLLQLTPRGRAWRQGERIEGIHVSLAGPQDGEPDNYDEALLEQLRTWRRELAREMGKPPYVVLHDVVLKRIAATRPTGWDELAAIKGIGPKKLERYGSAVLAVVANHKGGN